MQQAEIVVSGMEVARTGRAILRDVGFALRRGECVGLIGPNGAGKTTLLRAAFGLTPAGGSSTLARLPAGARARLAAYLPQGRVVAWPVPVRDLVALGRLPHLKTGAALPGDTASRVAQVLAQLGLSALAERDATTLSGGETARVLLARALVQDTPFIFADEPVAGLDPAHQIHVLRLLRDLADLGRGVLVTCHDLALAARFCTRLLVLHEGRLVADGAPDAVLTPALLANVFGLSARIEHAGGAVTLSQVDILEPMEEM